MLLRYINESLIHLYRLKTNTINQQHPLLFTHKHHKHPSVAVDPRFTQLCLTQAPGGTAMLRKSFSSPPSFEKSLFGWKLHCFGTNDWDILWIFGIFSSPPKSLSNCNQVVVSNVFYFHPYFGKYSNLTNI